MISRKDLAPLDKTSIESWRNALKCRKDETLWSLCAFCQEFFAWVCPLDYIGYNCDDCKNHEYCLRVKLTIVEVKRELARRGLYDNS